MSEEKQEVSTPPEPPKELETAPSEGATDLKELVSDKTVPEILTQVEVAVSEETREVRPLPEPPKELETALSEGVTEVKKVVTEKVREVPTPLVTPMETEEEEQEIPTVRDAPKDLAEDTSQEGLEEEVHHESQKELQENVSIKEQGVPTLSVAATELEKEVTEKKQVVPTPAAAPVELEEEVPNAGYKMPSVPDVMKDVDESPCHDATEQKKVVSEEKQEVRVLHEECKELEAATSYETPGPIILPPTTKVLEEVVSRERQEVPTLHELPKELEQAVRKEVQEVRFYEAADVVEEVVSKDRQEVLSHLEAYEVGGGKMKELEKQQEILSGVEQVGVVEPCEISEAVEGDVGQGQEVPTLTLLAQTLFSTGSIHSPDAEHGDPSEVPLKADTSNREGQEDEKVETVEFSEVDLAKQGLLESAEKQQPSDELQQAVVKGDGATVTEAAEEIYQETVSGQTPPSQIKTGSEEEPVESLNRDHVEIAMKQQEVPSAALLEQSLAQTGAVEIVEEGFSVDDQESEEDLYAKASPVQTFIETTTDEASAIKDIFLESRVVTDEHLPDVSNLKTEEDSSVGKGDSEKADVEELHDVQVLKHVIEQATIDMDYGDVTEKYFELQESQEELEPTISSDFKLLTSFRTHFVTDFDPDFDQEQVEVESDDRHFTMERRDEYITEPDFDKGDEEQESGLETFSREGKSLEDSTMDQGTDNLLSDRTDSLLRESAMHESFASDRTLSEPTLAAELTTDNDITLEVATVNEPEVKESVTEAQAQQQEQSSDGETKVQSPVSPPRQKEDVNPEEVKKTVEDVAKEEDVSAEGFVEIQEVEAKDYSVMVEVTPILTWVGHKAETSEPPVLSRHVVEAQDVATLHWLQEESTSSSDGSRIAHSDSSQQQFSSSPGQSGASTSSSYARSGTQSSIESHTTSRSSDQQKSSVPEMTESSSEDPRPEGPPESTGSSDSRPATTDPSDDYDGATKYSVDDSSQSSHDKKSPVSQVRDSEISSHSLPSSPRRSKPTGTTQIAVTSELFSTDSDLSRSLDIVYTEPEEDAIQKMSEKYRKTSSSGSSDSSTTKLKKRKPSVTQLGRRSQDDHSSSASPGSVSDHDQEEEIHVQRLQDKTPSPPTGKKSPSPTKICHPPCVSETQEQVSEEVISPVLEVSVQTPEKPKYAQREGE